MNIAGRRIGFDVKPYIIAEMSANHNRDLGRARDIITAAKEAGADAVKIQVYDAKRLAVSRGGVGKVIEKGPWANRTLLDIYTEGELPILWLPLLFDHAANVGITLISSVFDWAGYQALQKFDCPAYKIASFELSDTSLVRTAASSFKPMILSTGLATDAEIEEAYDACCYPGIHRNVDVAVLHCVSAYPCPVGQSNIARIKRLRRFYPYVGFSDHTLGRHAAVAAVALGACIIEKHLTLKRSDGGLDSSFSSEPDELANLVSSCRDIWSACQLTDNDMTYRDLSVQPGKALNVA